MGNRGDFEAVVNVTANASEARKEFAQLMREFAGTEAEFHAKLVSDRGEFKTFINKLQNAAQKHGIKIDIDTSAFDTAINEANRLQKALDSISLDSITDQFKRKKGLKANLFNISEKEAKAQAGQARAIIEKLVLGDRGKNQLLKSNTWGKFRDGKLASFNPGKEIELESLVAKNDVLFDRYEKKLANLNGMINRDSINNQDTLMDAYKLVYEISELQKEISRFNPKIVDKDENGKNKLLYNVDENIYENLRKKLEPAYQKVSAKISESLGISSNNIGSLADNLLEELVKVFQKASIPVEVEPKVDGDKFVEEVQKKVKGKKAQVEVEPVASTDELTEDQKKLQAEAKQRLNVLRNNLQSLINANKSGDQNLRKGILKQYAGKMSQFMDATEMPSEQDFFEFAKGFDNIKPYFGIFDDQKPVEVKVDVKPEVKPESVKKEVEKKTSKTKPKVEVTPVVDDKSDGKPSGDSKNILLTPDVTEFKKKSDEELAKIQLEKNVELKPDITGFEDSAKEKLSEVKLQKNVDLNIASDDNKQDSSSFDNTIENKIDELKELHSVLEEMRQKMTVHEDYHGNNVEFADNLPTVEEIEQVDLRLKQIFGANEIFDVEDLINRRSKWLGEVKESIDEYQRLINANDEKGIAEYMHKGQLGGNINDIESFFASTENYRTLGYKFTEIIAKVEKEIAEAFNSIQDESDQVNAFNINITPNVNISEFIHSAEQQLEGHSVGVDVKPKGFKLSDDESADSNSIKADIIPDIKDPVGFVNEASKQLGENKVKVDIISEFEPITFIDEAERKLKNVPIEVEIIPKDVDPAKFTAHTEGQINKEPIKLDIEPNINVELFIAQTQAQIGDKRVDINVEPLVDPVVFARNIELQAEKATPKVNVGIGAVDSSSISETSELTALLGILGQVIGKIREKNEAFKQEEKIVGKVIPNENRHLGKLATNLNSILKSLQGISKLMQTVDFSRLKLPTDEQIKDTKKKTTTKKQNNSPKIIKGDSLDRILTQTDEDYDAIIAAARKANPALGETVKLVQQIRRAGENTFAQSFVVTDDRGSSATVNKDGKYYLGKNVVRDELAEKRKADKQKRKDDAEANRTAKKTEDVIIGGLYENANASLERYKTLSMEIARGEKSGNEVLEEKQKILTSIFNTLEQIEKYDNQKDSAKYNKVLTSIEKIDADAVNLAEKTRVDKLKKEDVQLLDEATKAAREYGIAQAEAEKSDLPAVMERAADAGKKLDDVLDRLITNGGNFDLASYKEFSGLTDALENAEYKVNKAKQEQQRKTASKEGLTEEQKKVVTLQEKYDDLIKSAKEYVKLAIGVNRETGGYKDEVKTSRFDELKKDISDAKQGIGEYQSVVAGATSIQDKFNASLDEAFDEAGKESIADLQTRIAGLSEKKGFKTPAYDKYIDELNADLAAIRSKLPLDFMNEAEVKDFAHSLDEIYKKIEKSNAKEFTPVNALTLQSAEKGFEKWVDNNSAALRKFGGEIEEIRRDFSNVVSAADLDKVKSKFYELQMQVARTGAAGRSMWDTWKDRAKSFMAYLGTYVGFYDILQKLREGFDIAVTYDTQLTEMKKVSDETMASLKEFQKASFALGDSVGTTGQQVQASTADFMRLGESLDKAAQSALDANTLFKVSEFETIEEATEALISMSQAYQELSKGEINDILNHIGNNFSISSEGLATGLQKSAAALKTAGNDIYEASALITAGNQIIQDADQVGAGIRTISLRILGTEAAKDELASLGEDVDDFVVQTKSKIDQTVRDYTAVASNNYKGVSLLDDNGNYRSTYEILQDIANVYQEIVETDKKAGTNRSAALIEQLAGIVCYARNIWKHIFKNIFNCKDNLKLNATI